LINWTNEYKCLLSWNVLYPSHMNGWWSFLKSYTYCCMYLKRVWFYICDLEKHLNKYSCFFAYLSQLTISWGPYYDYFIYFKTVKSERLLIIGFYLFYKTYFNWISAILYLSLMTISSSPPIISLTKSTLIYASTPLLYIIISSSYLHLLLVSSRNYYPYTCERYAIG
jgi:hypothetical protein